MPSEVYTQTPLPPNCRERPSEPRRAGDLLPELLQRYLERSDKLPACPLIDPALPFAEELSQCR